MKHRGWFTLVIRAVGIMLVAFSIETFVGFLLAIFFVTFPQLDEAGFYDAQGYSVAGWTVYSLGSLAQLAFGLYLLFGGQRLIDYCLRSAERMPDRAVCIHCGYDLSQTTNATCPECGKAQPESERPGKQEDDAPEGASP